MPGHDAADALEEQLGGGLLQDHAGGAEQQGLHDLRPVDGGREQDGAYARDANGRLAQDLQARHPGHGQIEQENVRAELLNQPHGLVAVGRLTHDRETGLALQ
jgi:hypothetical protein